VDRKLVAARGTEILESRGNPRSRLQVILGSGISVSASRGSLCRSESIAKYNRLLEIECERGSAAILPNPLERRWA
jgi:enolase